MANTANVELLRDTTFFRGMDDQYLHDLAPLCRQEEFANGTTVFEGSDRAKEVHFIVDGKVSLAICDAAGCREVAIIEKGDVMGWAPLIGRTRLFDAARTISPVKTIVIDADELLKLCSAKSAEFVYLPSNWNQTDEAVGSDAAHGGQRVAPA